jgi:hypothetical protein
MSSVTNDYDPYETSFGSDYCERLRTDPNEYVSKGKYERMSKRLKKCFDDATFFHKNELKKCWEPCEGEYWQGRMSCWWNVYKRDCVVLPQPDLGDIQRSFARFKIIS